MIGSLFQRFLHRPVRQLFLDDFVTDGVEILPASRKEWVERQLHVIAIQPSPGETGWNEALVRQPDADARTVADLAIPFAEAARALAERLAPFDAVVTGDPNRPTLAPTALGFGPSPLSAVAIYEDRKTHTIGWIEVSLRGSGTHDLAVLSAMAALPTLPQLLVVDWNRGRVAELAKPGSLERFISSKA
jgi:hypothetical protein